MKLCAVCSGPLGSSDEGGHVHLNDSDDTHTPVVMSDLLDKIPKFSEAGTEIYNRRVRAEREDGKLWAWVARSFSGLS